MADALDLQHPAGNGGEDARHPSLPDRHSSASGRDRPVDAWRAFSPSAALALAIRRAVGRTIAQTDKGKETA